MPAIKKMPIHVMGIETITNLIDVIRNDIVTLEELVIIGGAAGTPIIAKIAKLESDLSFLSNSLNKLDQNMHTIAKRNFKNNEDANTRLKKLERLAAMVAGAAILLGVLVGYVLQVFKL